MIGLAAGQQKSSSWAELQVTSDASASVFMSEDHETVHSVTGIRRMPKLSDMLLKPPSRSGPGAARRVKYGHHQRSDDSQDLINTYAASVGNPLIGMQ